MTLMEQLKAELMDRGYSKQQCEAKVVMGVLEVLSHAEGKYFDLDRLKKEVDQLKHDKATLVIDIDNMRASILELTAEHREIIADLNEAAEARYKSTVDYIDQFFTVVRNCETPEGKDAMKKAQLFVDTVSVDTKYDNTAFIIGLAAILSNASDGGFALDELRKINPNIPRVRLEAKPGHLYKGRKSYGFVEYP